MTDRPRRSAAEFDLIARIRARAPQRDDVILGIGDDAAVLQVPAGKQLVVATDTLNAGVHFPLDTAPADIGWKALAVNLSDLAAMGARPAWCTLSLSLPMGDPAWLDGFLDGFLELAAQHGVALVGGDTTRGPLSIGVTVHGFVDPGRALRRDAAQAGDDVWVSGTLGDGAAALALLLPAAGAVENSPRRVGEACGATGVPPTRDATAKTAARDGIRPASGPTQPAHAQANAANGLRLRLDRPAPRIATGLALVGVANACIDISDGLLADLGHICDASVVGADLQLPALPASPALLGAFDMAQRQQFQATGGDDYELCFTAPVTARAAIDRIAGDTAVVLTRVGRIVPGVGVHCFDARGQEWQPENAGYVHFAD